MFHRRHLRRHFREAVGAEIARVTPAIAAAVNAANRDITMTELAVRDLPGAAAACPECGARMRVRRVKEGRRWWTLRVCGRCDNSVRPADIPAHRRLGGWRG
jgi:predicted RNA-binding Zn-ribbon protein involved in translation (DUF1610 family)